MPSKLTPQDWNIVKTRYLQGESPTDIAHDFPISRQAINERAKRETWKEDMPTNTWLELIHTNALKEYGNENEQTMNNILELIGFGMAPSAAGEYCGIPKNNILGWLKRDLVFNTLVVSAGRKWHLDKLTIINQAGDWKAADRLLQTNPLTREQYSDKSNSQSNTVRVVLSFERGVDFEQPVIVDTTCEDISVPSKDENDKPLTIIPKS